VPGPKDLSILRYTLVYGENMGATTIKLHEETKAGLDKYREYRNESYDEVIRKLLYIAKNVKKKPELSEWAVKQIMESRERMKKGIYLTEDEVKKRFGL
jgi:predicted transcriptional regulator